MSKSQRSMSIGLAVACLLVLATATHLGMPLVAGQTPDEPAALAAGGYTLTWWTVDGGGSTVGSGDYTLSSTAGQPEAAAVTDGGYTLVGGFWGGGGQALRHYQIYLPLIVRSAP